MEDSLLTNCFLCFQRTYNHVQNFRNAVNALSKPLAEINRILIQLRNSGSEGARAAAQGAQTIRPAMDLARNVVQAGEAFEEVAHELGTTNNLTRLQGAPLETGRNMVRQLQSMRLDILPRAIMDSPVGQRAFALFNHVYQYEMPVPRGSAILSLISHRNVF
jgi:hypothetical protein